MSSPSPLPDHLRSAQSTASTFRNLTWNLTIPVEVSLATGPSVQGQMGSEKGQAGQVYSSTDIGGRGGIAGGVDRYYMQCSRHTYLSLLLPELKTNFVQSALALDELEAIGTSSDDWWFELNQSDNEDEPTGNGELCRWYWPLDLIHLNYLINQPIKASSPTSSQSLRLILHLHPHPSTSDPAKPKIPNTIEACRIRYTSLIKEADYVRWGNTRRVTGLRRVDLESGWSSIVKGDYDTYSQFAAKTLPLPFGASASSDASSTSSNNQPQQTGGGGGSIGTASSAPDSAYAARAVPVKIYLPRDAPTIQDVVAPMNSEGKPTTVKDMLVQLLPGLFPVASTGSFTLAIPYLHGIELPSEAEMAWLGSCSAGADGWLRIGIRLNE